MNWKKEARGRILVSAPWQGVSNGRILEVEADAEGEAAYAAASGVGQEVVALAGERNVRQAFVNGLFGVVDGVLTKTIVVESGADMAAEVGAKAEREGHCEAGVVGIFGGVDGAAGQGGPMAGTFAGDEHAIDADAELSVGGDVVPELIIEVRDTKLHRDVDVSRCGVGTCGAVLIAQATADGVPEKVGLDEGSHHTISNVEAVADTVAEAEADAGVLADF